MVNRSASASDKPACSIRFCRLSGIVPAEPTRCEPSGARATRSSPITNPNDPACTGPAPDRGRNGIGHHDASFQRRGAQIISQRGPRGRAAVGNKREPEPVRQAQCPLNDVVMPRQQHRAAIAQMGEHRKPGIDRCVQVSSEASVWPAETDHSLFAEQSSHAKSESRSGASVTSRVRPRPASRSFCIASNSRERYARRDEHRGSRAFR